MINWVKKNISFYYQVFDYDYFLPLCTYLPTYYALFLVKLRGYFNAVFDLDWRSLSLNQYFVRSQTWKAINCLQPKRHFISKIHTTVKRFVVNSREEYEACFFSRQSMSKISEHCAITGFNDIQETQNKGDGIILFTPHFDSYCTGMILMGLRGLKLNAMTTITIRDARVNPAIQHFFRKKFSSMEEYFNGGKIVAYEDSKRFFYQVLNKGEALVMGADLPATSGTPCRVKFLGETRNLASGPMRLAKKTQSKIAAFVCLYRSPGKYELIFSPVEEATEEGVENIYQFLSKYILKTPERWWTSDLLLQYK